MVWIFYGYWVICLFKDIGFVYQLCYPKLIHIAIVDKRAFNRSLTCGFHDVNRTCTRQSMGFYVSLWHFHCNLLVMILFKVSFINNIATKAEFTSPHRAVEWEEKPYRIISLEVYANNNVQALELAQKKANALLKDNR